MNLPYITDEAIKQRDMLAKKTRNLQDVATEKANMGQTDHNRMIRENSELIIEMNLLRKEKKALERKNQDLENSMYTMSMERNTSMRSGGTNVRGTPGTNIGQDSMAKQAGMTSNLTEGAHNYAST